MKFFGLILANFKRHTTRTILTILSIMVAFVLFAYLATIRNAFNMGVSVAGANRLIVRHKVSIIQMLPVSYEQQIERIDGVTDATLRVVSLPHETVASETTQGDAAPPS